MAGPQTPTAPIHDTQRAQRWCVRHLGLAMSSATAHNSSFWAPCVSQLVMRSARKSTSMVTIAGHRADCLVLETCRCPNQVDISPCRPGCRTQTGIGRCQHRGTSRRCPGGLPNFFVVTVSISPAGASKPPITVGAACVALCSVYFLVQVNLRRLVR